MTTLPLRLSVRSGLLAFFLPALMTACGGASVPKQPDSNYQWYAGSGRPASAEELEVLQLSNEVRAKGVTCPESSTKPATFFPPAPALTWNDQLAHAARNHVQDMAVRNYFDHKTPEGLYAKDRVTQTGYNWQWVGENIAAGYADPAAVVSAWVKSPDHYPALMNPQYKELGVGFFRDTDPADKYKTYWGQVFGTPASPTTVWR